MIFSASCWDWLFKKKKKKAQNLAVFILKLRLIYENRIEILIFVKENLIGKIADFEKSGLFNQDFFINCWKILTLLQHKIKTNLCIILTFCLKITNICHEKQK